MSEDKRYDIHDWFTDKWSRKHPEFSSKDARLWKSSNPPEFVIGDEFGVHRDPEWRVESGEDYDGLFRRWGGYNDQPIHWLTAPKKKSELQLIYMAVSNMTSNGKLDPLTSVNSTATKPKPTTCIRIVLYSCPFPRRRLSQSARSNHCYD